MLYLLLLIFISICGSESNSGCSMSISVEKQENGVIYEYLRGDAVTCEYYFRANERQRIMLAVSHIGLLPKNSNEECTPQITISDVLFTGEERINVVICSAEDAKTKKSFVSASNSAKLEFSGPSDLDGILLIQFWFVEDVTLIARTLEPPKKLLSEEPIITLKCPEWGANLEIDSCSCVEYDTGKTTNLEPPFCLTPSTSLKKRCLQEESEFRHNLASAMVFNVGDIGLPPSCDDKGNYMKLQCSSGQSDSCQCVDPVSGNKTYLAPPNCELPITTTTEMPPVTQSTVDPTPVQCKLYSCQEFCPYGHGNDDSGCPTCDCKVVEKSSVRYSETCREVRIRMEDEIAQWKKSSIKTTPYPWVPECTDDGNFKAKQCNYKAGCFCVDQESGFPNGKTIPDCGTYKDCVTNRINALFKALRGASHKKKAKLIRRLLSGDDANDIQVAMDMLSKEEDESLLFDPTTHIPSCNEYGDYEALQCRIAEAVCWCVNVLGEEITGSESSTVFPDCSHYSRQVSSMPIRTNEIYPINVLENELADLHCKFENISESDNFYIFWTQNGIPINSFNNSRYNVFDVYYLYPTASSNLQIQNATAEDDGLYRCEIADTSNDYYYKSEPYTFEVWNPDPNLFKCVIQPCNKYCGMGFKTNKYRCPICECMQKEELTLFGEFYLIQKQLDEPFGTHDGRCEVQRQLIRKKLMELDLNDQYSWTTIENIPQCDSDGNYEEAQNLRDLGRVCVDKKSGQPSGRVVPECRELSPCMDQSAKNIAAHLAFFLNESTANSTYLAASQAQTMKEWNYVLEQAVLSGLPIEYVGNFTGLPSSPYCDGRTGAYYVGASVCSVGLLECWCVDFNGDEVDGSRVGVNETMPSCRELVSVPTDIPTLLNQQDSQINTSIGSTITLRCDVSTWSPDTYVMWLTPSGLTMEQMMVLDKRYQFVGDQVTDFSIQITDIQEKDAGDYTCYYRFIYDKRYTVYVN
ncbi:uncharacterized protein LOC117100270 isoform X2 [Anneissia japonica]|uniref:uncharacterized protein LOC117100270 isoform X2 n=2 Tax=Anneissia japonica TaxID=1529436 RepID=UPI0014259B70|nr:uncharacterized protein LOC117100270 isoform X2 [Anneissia japonica]